MVKTLVCCIAKDENLYIREWVEHYKNIGFTNVVIYDNNDEDDEQFDEVIEDYIKSGFAIIENFRGEKDCQQLRAYQNCYDKYCKINTLGGGDYDWIAFFDVDEFLELDEGLTLEAFLNKDIFTNADIIKVCWKNFTDNGLVGVENGNYSIKRFTETIEEDNQINYLANRSTKIIVRTGLKDFHFYMAPGGEHGWHLPFKFVDCHGNVCRNDTQVINERIWDTAWLNHYRFKTVEEFLKIKMKRLYPTVGKEKARQMINLDEFFKYNKWTKEKQKMIDSINERSIFCFIFNYNKDKGAVDLYNNLSGVVPTIIMDTYHKEKGDAIDELKTTNFVCYDNIYYGGLMMKAYEFAKQNDAEYMLVITSDVEIKGHENFIKSFVDAASRDDIGIWDPSAIQGSSCDGATAIIPTNVHQYCQNTNGMREVNHGEGWAEMINMKVADKLFSHLKLGDNVYGWNINKALNLLAKKEGFKVVIDDRTTVYHPSGCGYSQIEAKKEGEKFAERFAEFGIEEEKVKTANEIKSLVCCIGKNENKYIKEFVEWYKFLGISHIRIYDNNDLLGERFEEVIQNYIDDGLVDIVDYRGREVCQMEAYTECYKELKNNYDWIFFIDCDEFLILKRAKSIGEYLAMPQFINFDMIHLNWLTYGDNGHVYYENKPMMERFKKPISIDTKIAMPQLPENCHIKSIVRGGLDDIQWVGNGFSHTPSPNELRTCNDVGFTKNGNIPLGNMDYQFAWLNHYSTKTAEEYADKMKRGFPDSVWDGSKIQFLLESRFFKTNDVTEEKVQIFKDKLGIDMSYLLPKEIKKRDDVKIYSLCYSKKDFKFLDDAVITPLQVGAANGTDVCSLKDNTGDNISDKNYLYIENTGTYWIWKNIHNAKYKGQMQYRRPLKGIDENIDFDDMFEKYDVITCEPFNHPSHKVPTKEEPMVIPADTVEQGYAFSNCIDDLIIMEYAVKALYPDYAEDWDKYIKNGPDLYYSNGFIMREEDYDRYCEFLFGCLDAWQNMAGVHNQKELIDHVKYNLETGKYIRYQNANEVTPEAVRWQTSILGFLSERIWTLWLLHNFKKERIYQTPYIKMEEGMYT